MNMRAKTDSELREVVRTHLDLSVVNQAAAELQRRLTQWQIKSRLRLAHITANHQRFGA